ncbi:hypothetical protein Baya_14777 [Bagarius yarrelli]|uniref:Uncharacterized protein n=1 Tax=Bagarius yarrelli TaxID=175774 RepID=A0A556VA21_BAGYA|nr:hypothetical protein Baya_14777 [Bagarius yarrelli]
MGQEKGQRAAEKKSERSARAGLLTGITAEYTLWEKKSSLSSQVPVLSLTLAVPGMLDRVQTVPFPPASLLPQHCFLTPGQLSPGEQKLFWLMKPTVPRNAQNAYGTMCVRARVHSSQLQ